jgi:hypothetical protein
MGIGKTMKQAALAVAIFAGGVGAIGLIATFNDAAHPVSQGQEYLTKKGYKNVEGGDVSIFNTCGKNVFARQYKVDNTQTGKTEQRTVCFTLFGPSSPWIGK